MAGHSQGVVDAASKLCRTGLPFDRIGLSGCIPIKATAGKPGCLGHLARPAHSARVCKAGMICCFLLILPPAPAVSSQACALSFPWPAGESSYVRLRAARHWRPWSMPHLCRCCASPACFYSRSCRSSCRHAGMATGLPWRCSLPLLWLTRLPT